MDVTLVVEVEDTTLAKLDALAEDTNRPRETLVKEAVKQFVASETAQISRIRNVIARAERGDLPRRERSEEIGGEDIVRSGRPIPGGDFYLSSLNALLDEWNSPEDAEAFDNLGRRRIGRRSAASRA